MASATFTASSMLGLPLAPSGRVTAMIANTEINVNTKTLNLLIFDLLPMAPVSFVSQLSSVIKKVNGRCQPAGIFMFHGPGKRKEKNERLRIAKFCPESPPMECAALPLPTQPARRHHWSKVSSR